MLEATEWRDRSQLLNELPNIAEMLGKERFTDLFLDILKESLSDRIFVVRKDTIETIRRCTVIFGTDWFLKNILSYDQSYTTSHSKSSQKPSKTMKTPVSSLLCLGYLQAFKSDQNYLHRQTPLFVIISLSEILKK